MMTFRNIASKITAYFVRCLHKKYTNVMPTNIMLDVNV